MRYLNYDDVDGLTGVDSEEARSVWNCDLGDYTNIMVIEAGDTEDFAANTIVYMHPNEGEWHSYQSFYTSFGMYPWEWRPDEPEDCDYYCDCSECRAERGEENVDPYAATTEDDPAAGRVVLHIPDIEGRIVRSTSVEIEVGLGGSYLAEELYNANLALEPYMHEYHSGEDGFVRVEEDCSVAAEIIFSKMLLSNTRDSARFEHGIAIIREAIDSNKCKLDMRCGLHIHVGLNRQNGLAGYSRANLTSLYHLWNYLEDTIFRLASANWKGHRSEFGNSYSPKTQKGHTNVERMYLRGALNLGPYLNGATCVPPDLAWEDVDMRDYCDCPTVEFRVFNTSANARKIRAYVALTQALVAFAQDNLVLPENYAPMEWRDSSEEIDQAASQERLDFILTALPLTDSERDDIRYCASKCSLSVLPAL